ncbi:hypothetical protein OAA58_00845 [Polaribacter sp.]|nr:hypothetical protein [Polaribacter sp.]
MLKKIPNYIKYIFTNVFFLFIYITFFRALFYLFFAQLENSVAAEIQKAILLGVRFDLKLAALTFFPLAIFVLILNYRFFENKIHKNIAAIYVTLSYLIITLFYIFDFGYYEYLSIRLDASSLRFLSNFKISLQVLIESYPVYKGLIGLLILSFVIYKYTNFVFNIFSKAQHKITKKTKTMFFIFTVLILSFGVYKSITHYPLRWSEAFFSKNIAINQFTLNPVLYFFDSFAFRSEGVDLEKFKTYYPVIAKHLNLPQPFSIFVSVIYLYCEFSLCRSLLIFKNPC